MTARLFRLSSCVLSRVRVPLAASRAGIQGKENIYFSNFECECLSPSSNPPRAHTSTRHVEQVSLSVYTTLLRAARRREAENARLSPSRYLGREFAFFSSSTTAVVCIRNILVEA